MSLKIKLKLSAHAQIGSTGRSAATAKELVLTVDGEGEHLTLLVGVAEASYALSTLQQAHTKLLEKGKMTLAFAGRGGGKAPPHNVFLAAEPAALKTLCSALDEAAALTRAPGAKPRRDQLVEVLRRAWPDEVGKQLKVLREAASRDAPRPQKGRTRLMMVVGVGAGQTAATVGKKVAEACALTPRAAAKGLAAGSFVAVSRDAQKNLLLWLRVRPCAHHKLASAVWLELDAAEGSDLKTMQATILDLLASSDPTRYTVLPLAHGAIKEKLRGAGEEGLVVRLSTGWLGDGEAHFGTRAELRPEDGGAPLGRLDLKYSEEEETLVGPLCVRLEMHREACNAWCLQREGVKRAALARTLVSRVETFTLRLAASGGGLDAARPSLRVAGWKPEVQTAPFVACGFRFDQNPEQSMGFKLLKPPAPPAKKKREGVGGGDPETVGVEGGKRKRAFEEMKADGARKPAGASSAAAELAAAKEAAAAAAAAEAAAVAAAAAEEAQRDVLDLGDIMQIGRFAAPARSAKGEAAPPAEADAAAAPPLAPPAEGADEVDELMRELEREEAAAGRGEAAADDGDEVDDVMRELLQDEE